MRRQEASVCAVPCGRWVGDRQRPSRVSHSEVWVVLLWYVNGCFMLVRPSCKFVIVELDWTPFRHGMLKLDGWWYLSVRTVQYCIL